MHSAIQKAGISLGAFAVAGFAMSSESERMRFLMGELSREVASLFIPVFEMAQQVVGDVVLWLRNLSGEEQQLLGFFGTVVIGIGTVTKALTFMGMTMSWATAGISVLVAAGVA